MNESEDELEDESLYEDEDVDNANSTKLSLAQFRSILSQYEYNPDQDPSEGKPLVDWRKYNIVIPPPELWPVKDYRGRLTPGGKKYREYIRSARKRNLELTAPSSVMIEMFHQPCIYCGEPPARSKLNGIDRVDNDVGYNEPNMVPSCWDCNYMKGVMTEEAFYKRALLIAQKEEVQRGEKNPGAARANSMYEKLDHI